MPQGFYISHLLQRLAKLFISLSLRHLNIYLSCSLFSSFLIFFSRAAEIIFSVAESHARHHGSSSFAVEQLYGLLTNARRNLGVFQHHDGITGTAKDFVVVDYATRCVYVRTCGRPSLFNSAVSHAFLRPREDLRRVGQKLQGSGTYKSQAPCRPLADSLCSKKPRNFPWAKIRSFQSADNEVLLVVQQQRPNIIWEAWVRIPSKPEIFQPSFLQLLKLQSTCQDLSFLEESLSYYGCYGFLFFVKLYAYIVLTSL